MYLTERSPAPSSASGPLSAGDPSEEVTDEMVAAGVEVFWASGAVEGQLDSDEILVVEIFRAMRQAAP